MIVRDEAAVIERCLDSVLGLIDSWTICDTGSADRTPELIEQKLSHLPGSLHHTQWRDFGTNRSELMGLARESADYLLLIDADMTVEVFDGEPELSADAYELRHSGDLAYLIPRLVRADLPWRYLGATHEYLDCPDPFRRERLDALLIHHHADGGSRTEKFARDERLLRAELKRHPDDQRSTFYLAQTLRDLGRWEEALALYERRVELGGWDEEVFYAALQAGILSGYSDRTAGRRALERAHQLRPSRAEPLYELSRLCRLERDYEAALAASRAGLEIPLPDDALFVHTDVYEWGLPFEYSIGCYWCDRHEEAVLAVDRLIAGSRAPAAVASTAIANRDLSLAEIPEGPRRRAAEGWGNRIDRLITGVNLAEIELEVEPDWPRFNPSIIAEQDGFSVIVRTGNYEIDESGHYSSLDDSREIRTLNYLVSLDDDLALRDVRALRDPGAGPPRIDGASVLGFEDLRLIRLRGTLYATATVRDRNPSEKAEIALLRIDQEEIAEVSVLPSPIPGRHEKNWMPFELDGDLGLVYAVDPAVVMRCDPAAPTAPPSPVVGRPSGNPEQVLRGGSQGLQVADGTLFVVHEVAYLGNHRVYSHRLVLLNRSLELTAISRRFRFSDEPVELCAGIARGAMGLILSFGIADRHAGIAVCDEEQVLSLLEPVAIGSRAE